MFNDTEVSTVKMVFSFKIFIFHEANRVWRSLRPEPQSGGALFCLSQLYDLRLIFKVLNYSIQGI
jgi:hypothetical protein